MRHAKLVLLALAIGFWVAGCGGGIPGTGGNGGSGGNGGGATANPTDVLTEKLTEQELKTHLEVLEAFAAIPEEERVWTAGVAPSARAQAILTSKGVTWEQIGRTNIKLGFSLAALGMKEAMEEAKDQPPVARAMMERMFAPYKNVPEENIELVRKYRDRLDNLGVKGERDANEN